ncbi:MAG: hypothetical protein AAF694_19810 [Bacteroidota bacterium]
MDRIRALKQKMSKTEFRHFKTYMKAFLPRSYKRGMKMLELIEAKPNMSQQELIEQLYGDTQNKSFFHLKNQVEEKMLESLCISAHQSTRNTGRGDFPGIANIGLHFNLITAILLRKKGLREHSESMLAGCIDTAEELGLPEVKLLALVHARSISVSPETVRTTYKEDINHTFQQLQSDIIGIGYLDEIRVSLPQPANSEMIAQLEQYTQSLQLQLEQAYSPRAHYYHLLLQLILMEARQEPLAHCKQILKEMIEVLENHSGLKSPNRWGVPYVRLAELENRSSHYEAAYEAASQALKILPAKKTNHLVAGINKLYACIYTGRLSEAEEVYTDLQWVHTFRPDDIHSGWLYYLHAYLAFLNGASRLALKRHICAASLYEHKLDWNPVLRIFEIQLYIDAEKCDLAESRLEALRKHRERYGLSPRIEEIFKCLTQLSRDAFLFSARDWEEDIHVQALIKNYPWNPLGQEVLPFEQWLLSHTLDVSPYTNWLHFLNAREIVESPS